MVGNMTHLTVLLATVSCGKLSFRLQLKAKNEGSANEISGLTKLPGSYLRPRRFSIKCQRGTLSMMKKKGTIVVATRDEGKQCDGPQLSYQM